MSKKTGGQLNENTGRVERGRLPRGSVEDVATVYYGPFAGVRRRRDERRANR